MNRVRAMILLLALLGGTGAAVAQAASSSSLGCCAGEMCPVNKVHSDIHAKSPCGSVRSSDCPCSMDSSAAKGSAMRGPITSQAAILQFPGVLAEPKNSRLAATEFTAGISTGYAVSSEQPPR